MTSRLRASLKAGSAPAAGAGFVDMGGWDIYTPNAYVGTTPAQVQDPATNTGSRVYLVNTVSGNDATGQYLVWDGAAYRNQALSLTDLNGMAYGSDPFNPQGVLRPYKSFGYCGPRAKGSPPGSNYTSEGNDGNAAVVGPNSFLATGRNGYPDWYLFAAGVTLDVEADLMAWRKTWDPPATAHNGTFAFPGGASTSSRQIVGSYGPLSAGRARIKGRTPNGMMSSTSIGSKAWSNLHFVNIELNGHAADYSNLASTAQITLLYHGAATKDIRFYGCLFDGTTGINLSQGGGGVEFFLDRCIGVNTFTMDGGHSSFFYCDLTGSGNVLKIRGGAYFKNGYKRQDPALIPTDSLTHTVYDRNFYVSGELDCSVSEVSDLFFGWGGSADQFRDGLKLIRFYGVSGGVGLAANGGNAQSVNGEFTDCVLQRYVNGAAHQGGGMGMFFGPKNVIGTRCIVTSAGLTAQQKIDTAAFGGFGFGSMVPTWFHPQVSATTGCSWTDCIQYAPGASAFLASDEGVLSQSVANFVDNLNGTCAWDRPNSAPVVRDTYTYPACTGNSWSRNRAIGLSTDPQVPLFTSNLGSSTRTPPGVQLNTVGTGLNANTKYTEAAFLAAFPSAQGLNRTIKSWMVSRGIPVSTQDGADEITAFWINNMRKGQWDARYIAKDCINHLKAGFGEALLT